MLIKKNCKQCDEKFLVKTSRIKEGRGKYCGVNCYAESRKKYYKCIQCERSFQDPGGATQKKFCSYDCYWKFRKENRLLPPSRKGKVSWNKGICGENSHSWKGGRISQNKLDRHSHKYKKWTREIKERDNFTCQICSVRGGELHSNHIKKFSDFPKLRHEAGNGITLCKGCHLEDVTRKEEEWEEFFFVNLKERGFNYAAH